MRPRAFLRPGRRGRAVPQALHAGPELHRGGRGGHRLRLRRRAGVQGVQLRQDGSDARHLRAHRRDRRGLRRFRPDHRLCRRPALPGRRLRGQAWLGRVHHQRGLQGRRRLLQRDAMPAARGRRRRLRQLRSVHEPLLRAVVGEVRRERPGLSRALKGRPPLPKRVDADQKQRGPDARHQVRYGGCVERLLDQLAVESVQHPRRTHDAQPEPAAQPVPEERHGESPAQVREDSLVHQDGPVPAVDEFLENRFHPVVFQPMYRAPLLLAALLLAAPARSDSLADEADFRFRRAATLYRQGRIEDALGEFLASNRLVRNRNVIFNIARCFEQLAKFNEAYRWYTEVWNDDMPESDRHDLEAAIKRLRPSLALLQVESDPPGATVYVNRRDLGARGQTPVTLALPPGNVTAIVELPGFRPFEQSLTLAMGRTGSIKPRLDPIYGALEFAGEPAGFEVQV